MDKIKTNKSRSMIPQRGTVSKLAQRKNGNAKTSIEAKLKSKSENVNNLPEISAKTKLATSTFKQNFSSPRYLPIELKGRPKIFGNDSQIQALYTYTKKIASDLFSFSVYNLLFPSYFTTHQISRLSISSTKSKSSVISTNSSIPIHKQSSFVPELIIETDISNDDFSFQKAFQALTLMLKNDRKKVITNSDFFLLYVSLIITLSNEESIYNALIFLEKFLELGHIHKQESNILFAVLIHICDYSKSIHKLVVNSLCKLATLENSICNRLQTGVYHRNKSISNLSVEVLRIMGKDPELNEIDILTLTSDIPEENEAIKSLREYTETLESQAQLSYIPDFVKNIVSIMIRFNTSSIVLVKAVSCIESILPFYFEPNIDVIYNCFSVCFSILSGEIFLSADKSFDAFNKLLSLISNMFEYLPSSVILKALAANVAEAQGQKLRMIVSQIQNYLQQPPDDFEDKFLDEIRNNLNVFHSEYRLPEFLSKEKNKVNDLQKSIERLLNPRTVFEEINKIITYSTDGDFNHYPNYLHSLLQTAWIAEYRKKPKGMDQKSFDEIKEAILKISKIPDNELEKSEYSSESLAKTFLFEKIVANSE